MSAYIESGNLLTLVSLGGIVAQAGQGRYLETTVHTLDVFGNPLTVILSNNPRRISAIIVNNGPGKVGIGAPGNETLLRLLPAGSLQIDQNFPFTGPLVAYTDDITTQLVVSEISI